MIHALNFLEVYPYERWGDVSVPTFQEGETFQPTSLLMHEGQTTAPAPLTESDLISLMDKHGIGEESAPFLAFSFLPPAPSFCCWGSPTHRPHDHASTSTCDLTFSAVSYNKQRKCSCAGGLLLTLGTDATIAQHIQTITDREYVRVECGMSSPRGCIVV